MAPTSKKPKMKSGKMMKNSDMKKNKKGSY